MAKAAKKPSARTFNVAGSLDQIFAVREGVEDFKGAFWADIELLEDNPYQPRASMDELKMQEIMAGIAEDGQVVPAMVRPHPGKPNQYQLAHGHRRREAVKRGANAGTGWPNEDRLQGKLLVVERELNDIQMARIALEENDNREGLNVIDRAHSYLKYRELVTEDLVSQGHKPTGDDGLASWRQVAEHAGMHYRQMHRIARLLELEKPLVKALAANEITERHGRAFLDLLEWPWAQRQVLGVVRKEGLHALKTQQIVSETRKLLIEKAPTQSQQESLQMIEQMMAERLEADRQKALEENRKKLAAGTSHLSAVPAAGNSQSTPPTSGSGRSASEGTGMRSGGQSTPAGNSSSPADVVQFHLGPARKHLDSTVAKISELRMTADYRRRAIKELDAIDQLSRNLRKNLK